MLVNLQYPDLPVNTLFCLRQVAAQSGGCDMDSMRLSLSLAARYRILCTHSEHVKQYMQPRLDRPSCSEN